MTNNEALGEAQAMFNEEARRVIRSISSLMNKMDELNFAIQRMTDKLDDAKYATIELNKVVSKIDWEKED